jgi:hypothetical protein
VGSSTWACLECVAKRQPQSVSSDIPAFIPTVNFQWYFRNKGNVSKSRVDAFKSRCLAPHGKGEVVLKNKFGKITDRLASF